MGQSEASLGPVLACLAHVLGCLWRVLGLPWTSPSLSWRVLGLSGGVLGLSDIMTSSVASVHQVCLRTLPLRTEKSRRESSDAPCRFAPNASEWMGSRGNRGYGQENKLKHWGAINESHVSPKLGADKTCPSVYMRMCSDVACDYSQQETGSKLTTFFCPELLGS